ncbi:MAG: cytochrome c oxidase accessory protein CcoG [Betaproteobacteria bacterium]|nr:cytochrome c oxidase accessory protein CcoG [Betaproteobacteria bacterium]MDH5577193.1 cytochrome c oxidase accessory protein CcoG [Betaproteobacteria bacterium]
MKAPGAPAQFVEQALYEVRRTIHPRAVHGWFAGWRWALVWATQLVFYGLAWLPWNDRQAVLFDIAQRKFVIFGLILFPQDIIYLAVLLIIAALSLFLFTAVAGRLWCGYACPQTVYTEIFMWVERRIEGDRVARLRLDAAPLSPRKLALRAAKHGVWMAIALWTGFTFVGYFTPIRELWHAVWSASLGPWETFWVLFYGFATYGNGGWMREQVCTYMCPYARFQSAMFDKDTLIITYDRERGEPRGKNAARRTGLGHCVDCGVCVQVCPTGIDIRDGLQYECIGCAACIDGCDRVMDKVGFPRGLIRYSTAHAMENELTRAEMFRRAFRPRVLVYSAALWAIVIAAGVALWNRVPLKLDVIRDRAAISREIEGGQIENVYRLQVMNTSEAPRAFRLSVLGIPGIGIPDEAVIEVDGAASRLVPVRVRIERGAVAAGTHRIEFGIQSTDDPGVAVREKSVFIVR